MWRLQYLQNFKLLYIILKCDRLLLLNLLTGCNPGYYAIGDVCTGCPAGTYKSTAGNSEDLCTNCTADQFLTSNISSTVASDCGTCYFLLQFQGNYSIHKRVCIVWKKTKIYSFVLTSPGCFYISWVAKVHLHGHEGLLFLWQHRSIAEQNS